MSDAMQIARQRRKEHEEAIAKREREIEELREMIADLDSFIDFGQELINGPVVQRTPSRPIEPQQVKPVEPQLKEVQRPENRNEDGDNEWSSDDPGKSIANVLAARKA